LTFTTEFGGPVDPRNLPRAVEVAGANAGIENVGAHTLVAKCRGGLARG
jgi:hypothetical protein